MRKKDGKDVININEVLEFLQINYRFLDIFAKNTDSEQEMSTHEEIKKHIRDEYNSKTVKVLKALVYAFFGADNTNEKIIRGMKKTFDDKEINIGEQIFNIYKNYIEFKRMTQESKIESFSINAEVIPDDAKKNAFNEKADEIIKMYETEALTQ